MLRKRTLKILDWSVHSPHQYEMSKLGHNHFFLKEGQRFPWKWNMRPVPYNFYFIGDCDPKDYDLIIAHNPGHVHLINKWKEQNLLSDKMPLIYMFHFSPERPGMKAQMTKMLTGYHLIFNSYKNQMEWDMPNWHQRTIVHGFDIDEWPEWHGGISEVLNVGGAMKSRAHVTGYDLWKLVAKKIGYDRVFLMGTYDREGGNESGQRSRLSRNWDDLKDTLRSYDVYFSPTLNSPFPRARSEAFVTGCPIVSTSYHNSNLYIQHGVNGYIADGLDECVYYIEELLIKAELRKSFSKNARETAREVLSAERYRKEWSDFLDEVFLCT